MRILLISMSILLSAVIYGQTNHLNVIYNNRDFYISSVNRNDLQYFSLKDFSQLIDLQFHFNEKTKKTEIIIGSTSLIITAKNSFIIITDGKKVIKKYQIPVSTLLLNNEIFFPAAYCVDIFYDFLQTEITYSASENQLILPNRIKTDLLKINHPIQKKTVPEINTESPQSKYDIEKIEIDEKANGTLIKLKCNKRINNFKSSVQKNKLFVFINNATVSPNIAYGYSGGEQIKNIEIKKIEKNVQIEFTIDESLQLSDSLQDSMKDFDSNDIIITIFNKQTFPHEVDSKIKDWIFDTVVIDPGHGGKDPGAIGITGVKEKDVNLAIALKLGELIKKNMPDVKIVYTRKTDKFVELYKRGKIANENNGKLFISIHCNSMGKRKSDSRGFEVYLLRPGKTKRAIEIAEFENSVIKFEDDPTQYRELTDENFILVSMAHSSFMRYSEKFGEILHSGWDKLVRIPSRGVKQAGFYVLVGASMPGVLIETGFLSNRADETHLKSNSGQSNVANSIFQAIKKYKTYYDSELKK